MAYVQTAGHALTWLTSNARYDGVRVTGARHGLAWAGCIRHAEKGLHHWVESADAKSQQVKVRIRFEALTNEAYAESERLATLAHEMGHLFCGHLGADAKDWWPSRTSMGLQVREFEAESVARLVFRRLAPEIDLPPHLDQYFKGNDALPTDGWDLVVAAADRVIDMSQGHTPRRK